ncbi:unnamed protein product [Miscanthus lutarioriparius]|uniref:Retrotransposon gag domain-containing protein n=1 Tax=Miscanthus lutarioriparius TaxID=422564 RepID=A0A811N4C6_9POAL|nr:unnamed protein product [Miscanthus lutarioriparius]
MDLGERVEQALGSLLPQAQPVDLAAALADHGDPSASASTKVPGSAHLEPPPPRAASRSIDHGEEHTHRGVGFGVVYTTTPEPAPVIGAPNSPNLPALQFGSMGCTPSGLALNWNSAIPPFEFPKFDGSDPKLWIWNSETFFDLYSVPEHRWVKLATMNFIGSASLWVQTIPAFARDLSWKELGTAICSKFDRDEHDHLHRKFFHLKQTHTVTEYIEAFSDTVHQLLVHNPHLDPSFITNRFIDGLCDDIKSVVLVQRPHDIDTASSIALLQEEVLTGTSKHEFRHMDNSFGEKVSIDGSKSSMQPSPPYTKSTSSNRADTRPPEGSASKTPAEAMADLKSYRRAKGLCFKCGEKWGPGHKCPKAISLNAIKEIWKLFDDNNSEYSTECPAVYSDSGDDLMHITVQAIRGTEPSRTIRLQGYIAAHKAYMLIDSGSTHSFISEQLAASIPGWTVLHHPIQVRVANGSIINCTHQLKNQVWGVSGYTFNTTFKIIPRNSYDIILGMDWLQQNNPMQVHWQDKWLQFSHVHQLQALIKDNSVLYQVQVNLNTDPAPDMPVLPGEI